MDQFSLLKLIVAVADRGSLVGAARTLSISPSSATLGLQRLEDQAGTKLVLRSTRRLVLTSEGDRFVAEARSILSHVADTFEAAGDNGPLKGSIKLTSTHDFGRNQLVPLVDEFMRDNPNVHVSLFFSDGVVDLAEGGFDFAIRISGSQMEEGPAVRLLRRGNRRVCAAPAYWDRVGRPSHPRELTQYNCLFLTGPGGSESSWAFRESGRIFHIRVHGDRSANDGSAIRAWAVAGAGVLLNASFDVADDITSGRLEPVLEDFTLQEVSLYAVQARGRTASRRVRALVDYFDSKVGC
jgi:DNA-binding transcriptional LysR family regulator